VAMKPKNFDRFWKELKRRKVVHVITIYAATAFVILELVDMVARPLKLPDWTEALVIVLLCIGFVIAVLLSWVYDITPSGVRKTKPAGEIKHGKETTPTVSSGWKIATYVSAVIIIVLVVFNFISRENLDADISKLEKSIAVLPFKLLSGESDKQYLADGMMDAITLHLSKIKDLRVLSRTSTEQYRESGKTITEIGKELGVAYLLEGSFQKYGNDVRLIVQLIHVGKEGHVWANKYDRKWNDVLSVQSEVAQGIAGELDAVITPKEKQLIEKTPTYNLSAYDAYLQGEFYFKKFTQDDLMTAMKYFELAKERDSLYALAYAGIFKVWGGLQQMGYVSPAEAGPKAIKAALKSLLLDSTLAEVHYTLGVMETYVEWNWKAAEASFKKGIELNPNYAEARAYYSHLLNILGRSEEAMKQIEIALSLDPLNPFIKVFYGVDLIFDHKSEEATTAFQNALKIQPNYLLAIQNLAIALHLAGKYKESFEQFKLSYNSYPDVVNALDQGNTQGGYQQGFISANRVLEERFKSGYWNPTDIAGNYALAGDNDKAIEWLEKAYTLHDPNLIYLLMPHYDNLRNYPRFQALCQKMNLPIK